MKRILVFLSFIFLSVTGNAQSAAKAVTTHFPVSGNCDQCKKRIEDAAFIKGVKAAEWQQSTGELTITFRTDKTSEEKIRQSIAAAGYDTGDLKADEKAYLSLPACCQYRTHTDHH